mgnify:CR=1 FL=1
MVRQWMGPQDAYLACVRVRRGIADQGNPGVYARDKVYLDGVLAVTAHLDAHPGDFTLLMSGKVALDQLDDVRALAAAGLWVEPRFLPDMLGVARR